MRYADELVSEIISANDLVDVVSSYVKLKRSGNGYKGLCPFHGEKTPSFHVSPDKQLYHCFGCGAGGSVLQFIMNIENLEFKEAVERLAERAHIPLPTEVGSENDEYYRKRSNLLKINVAVAKFFNKNLFSNNGLEAQKYFQSRQLSQKDVMSFGLGYASDSFTECTDYLLSQGFDLQTVLDSGLVRKSTKTGKLYDFFRNRVIFPIIDVKGNVIAFGGRVMDDSKPKYLNSYDSLVFNKSKTLFAMNFAKKTCSERIVLCEGYMDVIALHKSGITNAVATLGTAVTKEHAQLLSRYTSEVILCYDSDEAGQKATAIAIRMFKEANVRTKVIKIPGAKDPDEFIRKKGAEAFEKLIFESESATLYKINKLKQQYNVDNIDEKIELTGKMAEIFAEVENAIEKDILIKQTATEFKIEPEAIYAQVRANEAKLRKKQHNIYMKEIRTDVDKRAKNSTKNNECELACLIAYQKQVYEKFKHKITPEFFKNAACKEFIEKYFEIKKKDGICDPAAIVSGMPPESVKELTAHMAGEKAYEDPVRAAEDIYERIISEREVSPQNVGNLEELQKMLKRLKDQ